MASGPGLATAGANTGAGVDHTKNSHLENKCSYTKIVGDKFYEYVATIEMLRVLATDENARKQLFENLKKSDFMEWQRKRGETLGHTYEFLKERWFGDPQKSEEARAKGIESLEGWETHRTNFMNSLKDALLSYFKEIETSYKECGVAYAFARVSVDGAFTLGELAIGAGAAAGASKLIKSLKFFVAHTGDGKVIIRVVNPKGGSYEKKFDQGDLSQKYGKPTDNHAGAKHKDVNRPIAKLPTQKHGRNTNDIEYDPETGRPTRASGTLKDDFGQTARGDNATAIGKLGGVSDDQGGHLVGHRFMGDTPDQGIVPQTGNLNTGAWKKMENEWADWIAKGYEVNYDINVYPPGSVRPDSFTSKYTVIDPKTGKVKYTNKKTFKNQKGETFDRVYFRDME